MGYRRWSCRACSVVPVQRVACNESDVSPFSRLNPGCRNCQSDRCHTQFCCMCTDRSRELPGATSLFSDMRAAASSCHSADQGHCSEARWIHETSVLAETRAAPERTRGCLAGLAQQCQYSV